MFPMLDAPLLRVAVTGAAERCILACILMFQSAAWTKGVASGRCGGRSCGRALPSHSREPEHHYSLHWPAQTLLAVAMQCM